VCELAEGAVHIFERAPLGNGAVVSDQGGSLENIDRVLQTGQVWANCDIAVLVTEDLFIVGATESMSEVEDQLGRAVRPVAPVSPTISYLVDCDLNWPASPVTSP